MLGTRIAALRRGAGMSQAELAKCLRVSASAIGMYEQGRREPAADTLAALADIFHVSIDYLVTGRISDSGDGGAVNEAMARVMETAQKALDRRHGEALSQKELAALIAVMLMEP